MRVSVSHRMQMKGLRNSGAPVQRSVRVERRLLLLLLVMMMMLLVLATRVGMEPVRR